MDPVTATKLIALPTTFIMAGYYLSASQNTLPNIYKAPPTIATRTFTGVYHRGLPVALAGSLIATTGSAYLAYALPAQRMQHATMAALALGVLPFTRIGMMKGIKRLISLSEDEREAEKAGSTGEVESLLRAWAAQNWVRSLMSFAGGITGLYATLIAQ